LVALVVATVAVLQKIGNPSDELVGFFLEKETATDSSSLLPMPLQLHGGQLSSIPSFRFYQLEWKHEDEVAHHLRQFFIGG